jgi:hypothetical protein
MTAEALLSNTLTLCCQKIGILLIYSRADFIYLIRRMEQEYAQVYVLLRSGVSALAKKKKT